MEHLTERQKIILLHIILDFENKCQDAGLKVLENDDYISLKDITIFGGRRDENYPTVSINNELKTIKPNSRVKYDKAYNKTLNDLINQ